MGLFDTDKPTNSLGEKNNSLYTKLSSKSDEELLHILNSSSEYTENAVQVAYDIMESRGVEIDYGTYTFYTKKTDKTQPIKYSQNRTLKKKPIIIFFILACFIIVICFALKIFIDKSNLKDLKNKITIETISWNYNNIWTDTDYTHLGLLVSNSSNSDLDITIDAAFYDKSGNYLENRKKTITALASNSKFFLPFEATGDASNMKFEYECSYSHYTAINSEKISANISKDGLDTYLSVHNSSKDETRECYCVIVFYDNSNNIENVSTISINNGHIPPGETVREKISYLQLDGRSEVYINAYTK